MSNARKVTSQLLDLVESGVVDKDGMIRDLLMWLSESEVAEFAERNGYVEEEEEDEDEDDIDEDEGEEDANGDS